MIKNNNIIEYKQKIISEIIQNSDIISLIDKTYINSENKCEGTENLIYKNIFPFNYIPQSQNELKTFISVSVDISKIINKLYKDILISICIISHRDIMNINEKKSTRIDLIDSYICNLFNKREDFGFGYLELESDIENILNEKYQCRILKFILNDFNIKNGCFD